jgi:hypothetical protein
MQGLGRPKMGARLVGRTHRGLNTQAGRRGGIGVTGAVVGATALVGSAVGIGSWYLGVTVDDWKYNLGLKVSKVRPRARDVRFPQPPRSLPTPLTSLPFLGLFLTASVDPPPHIIIFFVFSLESPTFPSTTPSNASQHM